VISVCSSCKAAADVCLWLAGALWAVQVVSRAHRMGAVAPVHVEVLAMKHTAEEHMVALRYEDARLGPG